MKTEKITIFLLFMAFCASSTYAGWSYEQPNSVMKYNSFTNSWGYEQPNSQMKYNSFTNSWGYEQPNSQMKYNSFTK